MSIRVSLFSIIYLITFFSSQVISSGDDTLKISKMALKEKFLEINRLPKEKKLHRMFNLAESLKEPYVRYKSEENTAHISDFFKLLDTIEVWQKNDYLQYFVEQDVCLNCGSYLYYLSLSKNVVAFDKILELIRKEKDLKAITALRNYNNLNSIAFLINLMLNDTLPKVRYVSAGVLGDIGNKIAMPFLKQALSDKENAEFLGSPDTGNQVCDSALNSLNKISGRNMSLIEWKNENL